MMSLRESRGAACKRHTLADVNLFVVTDIPEDEAQYWTGKLEHINTMRIHDEVRTRRTCVFTHTHTSGLG